MNYITEAFKALEDVNEGILRGKEVTPKNEPSQKHYTCKPKEVMNLKEGVYDNEANCIDMIHSIMAYYGPFKDGESLVSYEERNYKDYLKPYKDELGRDKVVELAQQQLDRPHRVEKNVHTDSEGLSYNALIFLDESLKDEAKKNIPSKHRLSDVSKGVFREDKSTATSYVIATKDGKKFLGAKEDSRPFTVEDELIDNLNLAWFWDKPIRKSVVDMYAKELGVELVPKKVVVDRKTLTPVLLKEDANNNKKTFKLDTQLVRVILPSQYYTAIDLPDEAYWEDDYDKTDANNKAWDKWILECAKPYIKDAVHETDEDIEIDDLKYWHPSKYNFYGDEIEFSLTIDNAKLEKLLDEYKDNDDFIAFLSQYRSRDGFISFMAADKDEFIEQNKEHPEKSLSQILTFNAQDNFDSRQSDFENDVLEGVGSGRADLILHWDDEDATESLKSDDVHKETSTSSLNESETVNLMDEKEVKEAKKFLKNEVNNDVEQIVDVDADTVDKLKDSYIGNVILQCPVCRTLIYKKPDMLVKDEDDELYNKEDECPHCGAKDGFEVVGQVASIEVEAESDVVETTGTDSKVEVDAEVEDDQVTMHPEEVEEKEEIQFESLDNAKFDKLVNKYLHNIYENVKDFKTTTCLVDDNTNKLVIEGVINFKDGKSNPTRFIFEQRNNSGLFRGLNESFSKSKNAFSIRTKVVDNALICESFKYNYITKVNDEKVIVRGRLTDKQ